MTDTKTTDPGTPSPPPPDHEGEPLPEGEEEAPRGVRTMAVVRWVLVAQTGVVMIVYIDNAFERRKRAGKIRDINDIIWAHMEGTVMRVRPKLMTVATMLVGIIPLLWATGSGADVMKRIAAPMVGGLLTSAFLTLEIIPVIYTYWRLEELLWERLEPLDPRRLLTLRVSKYVQAGGWGLLTLTGLTSIYVEIPGVLLTSLLVFSLAAIVGSLAVYLSRRPQAKRLVWPPAHQMAR